jgi:hypothetical protein
MWIARVLLCSVLTWSAANAEIAKLPEPYQTLAELARAAPPEFTANALLRLVEQGRLVDKAARRELIEEAFRNASAAKFPVRMLGVPGTTTDTATGSLSRAYALKLDALSLESRAVRDMLPLDPANARRMFMDIPHPALPPLTCDDALFYDLSDYYQTLGAVAGETFTQKERAKEAHLNFLTDYLGQATSPLEIVPLAGAIQAVGATEQQRQGLYARLGGLLENLQPDDRSFASSLPAINALNVPEMQSALEKFRQRGRVCESDSYNPSSAAAPKPASQDPSAPPAPTREKTPKLHSYWQSAGSKQLLEPGRKLRFDKNNTPLSDSARATPEWQQQAADYLNQIAGWSQDPQDSDADYYHEKCTVWLALIELVPPGPENDAIVADYVSFIGNSRLYQESPAEWFLEPKALLDRFQPGAMRSSLLDAFQRSGNPVLSLEVALERARAPKPNRPGRAESEP